MISNEIWEREIIRERKRLKRRRQVFFQKMLIASLCFSFTISGLLFLLYNTLYVEAKEPIYEPIVIKVEPIETDIDMMDDEVVDDLESDNILEENDELEVYSSEEIIDECQYLYNISDEDKLLFKQIISAESYNFWSYQDCLTLATVVINRLNSETFPHSSSIREILTSKSQFETYSNGRYEEVDISESADEAVEAVLKGETNLNSDVMYFCTSEYYEVCSADDFFKSNLDDPVYQVRNVLFFEEP